MFFDFFFDRILEERHSEYNGEIKVIEYQGQKKLIANNLMQSGMWISKMWEKPIKHVVKTASVGQVKKILLLGLGGGTLLSLFHKYWPEALVTAVEIDQHMVDLAKKYFDSDKYQATIIVDDAFTWIHSKAIKAGDYDLIVIDLFCGDRVNPGVNELNFIKQCIRLLSPQGVMITNLLFYQNHKQVAEKYIQKFDVVRADLELIRHRWNLFVCAKITHTGEDN